MRKIEQGKTYSAEQYKLEIKYISAPFFYCLATDQHNHRHWHTGHIYIDNSGNEEIQLSFYNSEEMFKYTEEKVRAIVDEWVKEKTKRAEVEARVQAEADENNRIDAILLKAFQESREIQKVLIEELRQAVIKSGSTKSVLKDKKAAIEQLTAVNTLINSGIYKRF